MLTESQSELQNLLATWTGAKPASRRDRIKKVGVSDAISIVRQHQSRLSLANDSAAKISSVNAAQIVIISRNLTLDSQSQKQRQVKASMMSSRIHEVTSKDEIAGVKILDKKRCRVLLKLRRLKYLYKELEKR